MFDRGYPGRFIVLSLLAPNIIEAILDGRPPAELGVHVPREAFAEQWGEQRGMLAGGRRQIPRAFALNAAVRLRRRWPSIKRKPAKGDVG